MIKSVRIRLEEHVDRMEEGKRAFKMLRDKLTGKRFVGRLRRRWEDNNEQKLKKYASIRGIGLIRLRKGIIGEPL